MPTSIDPAQSDDQFKAHEKRFDVSEKGDQQKVNKAVKVNRYNAILIDKTVQDPVINSLASERFQDLKVAYQKTMIDYAKVGKRLHRADASHFYNDSKLIGSADFFKTWVETSAKLMVEMIKQEREHQWDKKHWNKAKKLFRKRIAEVIEKRD